MATSMPHSVSIPAVPPVSPAATVAVPTANTSGMSPSMSTAMPTTKSGEESWRADAACGELSRNDAALFFSEVLSEVAAAKRICAECPVLAPCLEGAIARAEPCGVWGGQLFENGRVLMQKRRRGRPPKVARADDELPVVAVPVHLADRLPLAG